MKRLVVSIFSLLIFYEVSGQIFYDFENADISGWIQKPAGRWQASTINPLSGEFSLKHTFDNTGSSTDTIMVNLPSWNVNNGDVTWRMLVRHGYNPSSSNSWWIYLMTGDEIATGTPASGYAVGVNLSGSDDMLKVWRVDNGIPQALLSSTLNWETTIGTANVGAIEVKRLSNGTFNLKASAGGTFDNLNDYGSAVDVTYAAFKYLSIQYRYTSSADLKLWVDNIGVDYQAANPNDTTTTIYQPMLQIPSGEILSTSTTPSKAVDVLRFVVEDMGSGDGLPTYVKRVAFTNPIPEISQWNSIIAGVLLKGANGEIPIKSSFISNTKLTLEVDSSEMIIPDGLAGEYTLSIFLKSSGITDGTSLQFKIDSIDHEFLASVAGSGFPKVLPHLITSGLFTIRVDATMLKIHEYSHNYIIGKPFALGVAGCDSLGNVDTNFNHDIALNLVQGSGQLSSLLGLVQPAIGGIAIWNDLIYNKNENIRIEATSQGLSPALSSEIFISFDTTSYAGNPSFQPEAEDILSTKNSAADAVEVMRIKIFDVGGDSASTLLKSLRLTRANLPNMAALNKVLGGILVKSGSTWCGLSDVQVKTSTIDIYFSNGSVCVPEGGNLEIGIWVYLKPTGITDNQTITLYIDPLNPLLTAYDNGTQFSSTFPSGIYSSTFTIRVHATHLKFDQTPARVGVNEAFPVVVKAADINGNTDTDYFGSLGLGLAAGDGHLDVSGGTEGSLQNGIASFIASYSKPGSFALLAMEPTLEDVASPFITCGDADGQVYPLFTGSDTLIFTAQNTNTSAALEIFRLKVSDSGTSDGLPLKVKTICLTAFNPNSASSLEKIIGGFMLRLEEKVIIPIEFSQSEGVFYIQLSENQLEIADGDTIEMGVELYLNPAFLKDNEKFQFYIPSSSHGWVAYDDGTAFCPNFLSYIYGLPCSIEVEADRLAFNSYPFAATPNDCFDVEVISTDCFGNPDANQLGQVTLSENSASGNIEIPDSTEPLSDGIATWSNIKFLNEGRFTLKASHDTLLYAVTPQIFCGYSQMCLIEEAFEGDIPGWGGVESWRVSTISPVAGGSSLVHAGDPGAEKSELVIPLNANAYGRVVEWNVVVKTGSWDPSTDNYFYMVLGSTDSLFNNATTSGYAVGINPSEVDDFLSLWHFEGGKKTNLITTRFDWSEKDEVEIRVTLSPTGILSLWYKPKDYGRMVNGGEVLIQEAIPMKYAGFVYAYTPTRAGQLWLDNLKLCLTEFPPLVKSVRLSSLNSVKVSFSKNVSITSASIPQNYLVRTAEGEPVAVKSVSIDQSKHDMAVLTTEKLSFGSYTLYISNIEDEQGHFTSDSATFGLGSNGNFGRLVINEIMANPIPSNGLPEYEYIELYNPSADTVFTKGWRIVLNDLQLNLPLDSVLPRTFTLIGGSTAMSEMAVFGKTMGVTSFPSLLNDGMLIKLIDGEGNLISFASYSSDWYNDDSRSDGGYSLECIDASNIAEGKRNWHACMDELGGTPCKENSVVAINPDITPPKVIYLEVLSEDTIRIAFSEPMDSLTITDIENYSLSSENLGVKKIMLQGNLYDGVKLILNNPMELGSFYQLAIGGEIVDFSGNPIEESTFKIGLPQIPAAGDLVVNEVLFNPYSGGVDFVEIFNNSQKCIDLKNLFLANRNTDLSLNGVNPAADTSRLIFPAEYAVITVNPQQVKQFYYCENEKAFVQVSSMASLNSDEGYVVLLNANMDVVDELHYTEKLHNPIITNVKGVSLERINPKLPSADASTWHSAAQSVGFATPTFKNSQYAETSMEDGYFTISPEIISPDGDGKDDFLQLCYSLPAEGYVSNIRIFTSAGVEVFRLANNLLLGREGCLRWDGVNYANRIVPTGIYVVYVEYFNLSGEVKREKRVCVVAER